MLSSWARQHRMLRSAAKTAVSAGSNWRRAQCCTERCWSCAATCSSVPRGLPRTRRPRRDNTDAVRAGEVVT
ncbi:unnamed protein product [Symbiodinium microadriaticum]|nr:unnamed protein product [Symbiodinium microadriaticum]